MDYGRLSESALSEGMPPRFVSLTSVLISVSVPHTVLAHILTEHPASRLVAEVDEEATYQDNLEGSEGLEVAQVPAQVPASLCRLPAYLHAAQAGACA
eukprot:scaffold33364_cov146-Isochrysis_galbana.AAC.4